MDKDGKDTSRPRSRSKRGSAGATLPPADTAAEQTAAPLQQRPSEPPAHRAAATLAPTLSPTRSTTLPPTLSPATAAIDLASLADPLRDFLAIHDDVDDASALSSAEGAPALEDDQRFLSFDLGGEAYAASIMDVREILKVVTPTEVPRAPREVLGVLSKRGVVMPVIDLAAVLGLRAPDRTLNRDQRVLVVGDGQRVLGLRVDRVRQVVRLPARALEEVPASLGNKGSHLLLGLGRPRADSNEEARMLILLDVDAVLAHVAEAMGVVLRGGA